MLKLHTTPFAASTLLMMLVPLAARAEIAAELVVDSLDQPMFLTHAPGDPGSAYIVERAGTVRVLDLATRTLDPMPFLELPDGLVNTAGEGGLLGLTFDPDYAANGRFYVNLTTGDSSSGENRSFRNEIRRYEVGPGGTVDTSDFDLILSYDQPQNNHNAGWIGFNPAATGAARHDLYIPTGDGGGGNDDDAGHTPGIGNAQDITDNLLGKVLRINVAGDSNYTIPDTNPFVDGEGDDEIFAHGLRNPFRASFDRLTGELYIGDVGQGAREEVDRLDPAVTDGVTGRAPARNFGWRLREGNIQTPGSPGGAEPDDYVPPIYDYQRIGTIGYPDEFEGNTVLGGYVYRGPVAELQGLYIFGDYQSANIWAFDPDDPFNTIRFLNDELGPDAGSFDLLASFGEDAAGNVYILDFVGGEVFVIVPEPALGLATLAAAPLLCGRRRKAVA